MDTNCIPTCRVCMQKSPEFVDFDMPLQIENEEDTSITYLDFFFECTRIEVEPLEEAGGSSYCFCLPCGDELCSFYKFVKIAQMTDGLLKAEYRKSSRKNKNSTSHKINELEELDKNVCSIFEEVLLCTEKNDQCRDEDAVNCPLEDGNDQQTVENSQLIKLRVEPYLENKFKANNCLNAAFSKSLMPISSENEVKTNENHCKKNTTKKLIKKKSRTGPAECAFCHEILRNQKLLDLHLVEEHQRRTKPCVLCGKMVIRMRDHLLIHEREKHSIKRPKIECSLCFRMISKQTISRHIRHVHQREIRNHKCNECSQTFADAHKLKVHILKGHNSGINIKCILCPRTFSNKNSLKNHLRIHPCLKRVS